MHAGTGAGYFGFIELLDCCTWLVVCLGMHLHIIHLVHRANRGSHGFKKANSSEPRVYDCHLPVGVQRGFGISHQGIHVRRRSLNFEKGKINCMPFPSMSMSS